MDSNSSGLSSDSSAPEAVRRRGLHALQRNTPSYNSLELRVQKPRDVHARQGTAEQNAMQSTLETTTAVPQENDVLCACNKQSVETPSSPTLHPFPAPHNRQ